MRDNEPELYLFVCFICFMIGKGICLFVLKDTLNLWIGFTVIIYNSTVKANLPRNFSNFAVYKKKKDEGLGRDESLLQTCCDGSNATWEIKSLDPPLADWHRPMHIWYIHPDLFLIPLFHSSASKRKLSLNPWELWYLLIGWQDGDITDWTNLVLC